MNTTVTEVLLRSEAFFACLEQKKAEFHAALNAHLRNVLNKLLAQEQGVMPKKGKGKGKKC